MLNKKVDTSNRIMPGIQSFAWNADRSKVAVCPQSREILIFKTNQKPNISDWTLLEVLKEVSKSFGVLSNYSVLTPVRFGESFSTIGL